MKSGPAGKMTNPEPTPANPVMQTPRYNNSAPPNRTPRYNPPPRNKIMRQKQAVLILNPIKALNPKPQTLELRNPKLSTINFTQGLGLQALGL